MWLKMKEYTTNLHQCVYGRTLSGTLCINHDDVIKWKHFRVTGHLCGEFTGPRWIPLTKASDTKLWCFLWSTPWINSWVNNHEAGDLRRQRPHYDVIVMIVPGSCWWHRTYLAPGPGNYRDGTSRFEYIRKPLYLMVRFSYAGTLTPAGWCELTPYVIL